MLNKFPEKYKKYIKTAFWIVVFVLLFYIILPDKQTIQEALEAIKGVSIKLIIVGSVVYYLTIPLYAFQIYVLSILKLNCWITYKVQMSVLFVNKVIPSGIASFVMNSFYLARKGNKPSEVASVIAMQGLTSSIPFMIMLLVALILAIYQYDLLSFIDINLGEIDWTKIIILIVLTVLIFIYILKTSEKIRKLFEKTFGSFWVQIKLFKDRPVDVAWALATGFVAPIFGVTVLYISARAVGLQVTFIESYLVYSLGTTIANLVPVPGGIGAAMAGLYAGFTILGYPAVEAWAAAIVYRLITFWIPIIPGFAFFINLRKSILKDFNIMDEFQKAKKLKKA